MSNRLRVLPVLALIAAAVGAAAALAQQPAWVSAGPADVGTIYDLKAADGVVYAATSGGVYRSTSSGDGWELAGLRSEWVWAISVRAGSPIFALSAYGGLAASRDGGGSWDRLAPSGSNLSAVAVDPEEPATVYLASSTGAVWKSTDSGATWKRLPPTDLYSVNAIAFDPHDDAVVLQGYSRLSNFPVLRRSTDGGMSFTAVSITGQGNPAWFAIGAGAPGSSRFYAAIPGFVCVTADGTATWTCSAVSSNVGRIVEVPANPVSAPPVVLAITDRGALLVRNGGGSWGEVGAGIEGNLVAAAFDADSGSVFAGTDAGIYRSTDRGATWSWHGHGLRSSWVSAIAVDPSGSNDVMASTVGFSDQGPGLFRSGDLGRTWSSFEGQNAPSGFSSLLFEPSHPSRLYGVSYGTFYWSEDAGGSWSSHALNSYYFSKLAIDPRTPGQLWAADQSGLARTTDGGTNFQRVALSQTVYDLVFDSHDPATLYAGSYLDSYGYYGYPNGGSIFVSRDLGATWTQSQDVGAPVIALAADPFAGGVVYAGTSGAGVQRSSDGGRTWAGALADSPRTVSDVVADPSRPGVVYAAADGSVFRSRDGGKTWQPFGDGFDGPPVADLSIAGGGRSLVAATSGGGIYQLDLGVTGPSFPCVADAEHLCLIGGRYALEVAVQGRSQWSAGAAHAMTDRSGYFGFPAVTGDAGFPEVVVKMLPSGALGPGGAAIFHSSLTSLLYVLTLTDTVTGEQHLYQGNEGGSQCGGVNQPFPDAPAALVRPEATAAPSEGALSLLDHRFSVTIHARDPRTGRESDGLAVAGDDRWGYFSMPDITGDPALPEIIVKMVDFTGISGKFWVFYTGLTGFDYTLTVTDTKTGAVRTYESTDAFCGAADTSAFPD